MLDSRTQAKHGPHPVRLMAEVLLIVALAQLAAASLLPLAASGLEGPARLAIGALLLMLLAGPAIYWRCISSARRKVVSTEGRIVRRKFQSAIRLTAGAQLLGLALTGTGVYWLQRNVDHGAGVKFERGVERIQTEVVRRFERSLDGLKGARGAYAASAITQRHEFRAYVESREVENEFPGIRGFGFIERVARKDLARFEAAERADGAPDFKVQSRGDAPDLYVIKHIEPLADNRSAWGYDIGQEPVRREAAERAVHQATLSGRITLLQDGKQGAGFLYLMPVYKRGVFPSGPQEREKFLAGLLYVPIVVAELMDGVALAAASEGSLNFELFDGDARSKDNLVFDAEGHLPAAITKEHFEGRLFEATRAFEVGGRTLMMRIKTTPSFESAIDRRSVNVALVGGVLGSFLLALSVWLLASSRARAQNTALRMTADLDRLARVVMRTSNAVIITDTQNRITWVNKGFTRISGYTMLEAVGRTPGDLLTSSSCDPAALRTLAEASAAQKACRIELINRAKDGHDYWIDIDLQPILDEQGKFSGYMEIDTDITAKKQIDQRIRQQNQLMESIVENLPCGLAVFDESFQLSTHNSKFRELLDLPDSLFEQSSVKYADILQVNVGRGEFGNRSVEDVLAGLAKRARNKVQQRVERKRSNGATIEIIGSPMPEGGFVLTYLDITERKAAEAAIQRSETLMRAAIDAVGEAFVLYDPQDQLVYCNEKYRSLYVKSADQIVPGATFEEILRFGAEHGQYPHAIGRAEAWVAERLAQHQSGDSTVVQHLDDGRCLRIIDRKMPDGHTVGFRIDITDLVKAREAAEQMAQAKGQFLANMSHEIRTPMNAILGMLKLLQTTELTSRQLDYASKAEGAARSLLGLLNDILDFSKVEAGRMTLDPRPFRVDQLMRDLSVILSPSVGNKDVEVLFDIDPQTPRLLVADDMRLRQVLINLGGNAIKFTPQGQVVLELRVIERGEHDVLLEFSVRDSGIGIAPENHVHIFSGFSQAEASTTRRFGGTGLGLAICQRLVGLMDGELKLESVLGQGSRFYFQVRFPLGQEGEQAENLALQAPTPSLGALHALIVDDNAMAREVLARMADSMGWHADVATSGEEAINMVRAQVATGAPYQAIFVDWQMPGLDGWETSLRIRQSVDVAASSPLVVMVTAHGREMLSKRSAEEQALLNGFLVKPVTASMLFDAVADARAELAHPELSRRDQPVQLRRLEGLRLLVVEDNKINQQVADELLSREGAWVTLADNGQLGVDALAKADPMFDGVLMDVQMPVMDGYTAAAHIRQKLGLTELPVIAMTANAMASDREAALAAGMNDHVGKPFDLDHLVSTLLRCTGRPAAIPARAPSRSGTSLDIAQQPAAASSELLALTQRANIDLTGALARLGGDRGMYQRLLRSFFSDLAGLLPQLSAMLPPGATGQTIEAGRLMHTFNGLAATLGLSQLQAVALQAERDLKTAGAQAGYERLVESVGTCAAAVQQDVADLLDALDEAAGPQASAPSGANEACQTAWRELIEELADRLGDADMAALDLYEQIRKSCPTQSKLTLQPLDDAMAALDFERALELCNAMTKGVTP